MIDALLQEAGLTGDAVEALAFGCGPGAFTSLRIACGVAQGLALAWNKPVLAIDALRTLAYQAQQAAGSRVTGLWVALDVRMGEVCYAAYPAAGWDDPQGPAALLAPTLGPPHEAMRALDALAAQHPGPYAMAGDGLDAYPVLASWWAAYGAEGTRPAAAIQPDARAVARLAERDYGRGHGQDAALVAPWYLRDKVALDLVEQQALRQQRDAARGAAEPEGATAERRGA
jgi:tRNA threonylcarbamoyladenosine biosynthesis protein TsaB